MHHAPQLVFANGGIAKGKKERSRPYAHLLSTQHRQLSKCSARFNAVQDPSDGRSRMIRTLLTVIGQETMKCENVDANGRSGSERYEVIHD